MSCAFAVIFVIWWQNCGGGGWRAIIREYPMGKLKYVASCVINNKAFFRNLLQFLDIHKRVSHTWIIEALNHSSNSTIAFTENFSSRCYVFCKYIVEFEVWLAASIVFVEISRREVWQLVCGLQNKLRQALLFTMTDMNTSSGVSHSDGSVQGGK